MTTHQNSYEVGLELDRADELRHDYENILLEYGTIPEALAVIMRRAESELQIDILLTDLAARCRAEGFGGASAT